MSDAKVLDIGGFQRIGRGGARPGAGRKRIDPALSKKGKRREEARGYYVYVVHEVSAPGICKIGVATDPMARFSALQVGNWREMALAGAFGVGNQSFGLEVEKAVHDALASRHCRGEWFRVEAQDACRQVLNCIQSLGGAQSPHEMVGGA